MNPSSPSLDKPRFSVIIPVYNGERFIGETIQSVLAQTYQAAEIIIVDDGSSDDTAAVVERYSSQITISYVRQQNQGPSAARNRAVSLAQGDWIAFLDADDLWYSNKLQTHRDYIMNYPDIALFWCDMNKIDEQGASSTRFQGTGSFGANHLQATGLPTALIRRRAQRYFRSNDGFQSGAALLRRR